MTVKPKSCVILLGIIKSSSLKGLHNYTSHGYECGFYSELILVESKAIKQAHSSGYATVLLTPLSAKSTNRKPQLWPREV
jgi:hypothetical protein